MEFSIGALAAVGATLFTNPIEVLKTRFQLQGELQQRGQYTVHYRNVLHAGYVIVKTEGALGLQKGLVPAIGHQILMNGVRLGGFHYLAEEKKLNLKSNGEISFLRTAMIGGATGVAAAYSGSPFYLIKIRMQAQTAGAIAVGTQHKVSGTADAFTQIWKNEGIAGLWRGANGSVPRLAVASAGQLSTFALAKQYIATNKCRSSTVFTNKRTMEFSIGALAAVGATLFTNPIEVLKTRFQLQGELQQRGQYTVHYRNVLHAGYVIVKTEGALGLQRGLVPALGHQILMNGVRLGGFHYLAEEKKLNLKSNGEISFLRTAMIGGLTGVAAAYSGSPFYLIKIRKQAQSTEAIAVGTQHKVSGTADAFIQIWKNEGIAGLWRGANSAVPRLAISSAGQLSTFSLSKEYIATNKYYPIEYGLLNSFLASFLGGLVIAITMSPLDVISTRLYNQGVDTRGKGLIYSSYFDCLSKIWKTEGFSGFYKGIVPSFMRIGPHTTLSLIFWDKLKDLQRKYLNNDS